MEAAREGVMGRQLKHREREMFRELGRSGGARSQPGMEEFGRSTTIEIFFRLDGHADEK